MKKTPDSQPTVAAPMSGQRLFSVNQTAAQLGISRSLLYNSIRILGILPIKVGRSARFDAAQIEEIVEAAKRGDLRTRPAVETHRPNTPRAKRAC